MAKNPRMTETKAKALGCANIWAAISVPRLISDADFVMTSPVAIETRRAGIWVTRPSPMVSKAYVESASIMPMLCCSHPTRMPPMLFTITIMMPAMASPLTNLFAPSIEPKKVASCSIFLLRALASFASIRPAFRSASMLHLFSRHRVQREPCRDLGDPLGASGYDDELDYRDDHEYYGADDIIPSHDEIPERVDHFSGVRL